jgi:hypothetical protein
VPVELGLGDPNGLVEILIGQSRVPDGVTVMGEESRLHAT